MAQVPKGTTYFIASAFAAARTTTIVSNAVEAVVTSAAHGYANGDILEVTSGWGRLNKRAFRIKSVATDTFVLEGADTASTQLFPPGTGVGSVRKVNTFTQIQQVLDVQPSGGDPKTVNYSYHESDVDFSINDGFNPTSYTMELDADSIGTAGYTALRALTDVQTDTILRINTRNGALIFQPCTVALNEAVRMQNGQINRVVNTVNGNNRLTRYAS
jgi:hypothetical protein